MPADNLFDPEIALATGLVALPGVYALLVGSGVSTGVQIPTGYGVMRDLVRRAAAAANMDIDDDFDHEQWWAQFGGGTDLGYSTVLERLGPTPAERQSLLARYFEPTEEERENGFKVPGVAHKAIASLVSLGLVKVIVTTNFDRLIETALTDAGIAPQVITSESDVRGMQPLAHSRCTVIKINGDYASLSQRNTVTELDRYPKRLTGLLDRVLDEYGLVACGWSGDWDRALVRAISRQRSRRYSFYWSSYRELSQNGARLATNRGATLLPSQTADEFFEGLLDRVEAVRSMSEAPMDSAFAVARLKRNLVDPHRHIELRDLFNGYLRSTEESIRRPRNREGQIPWSDVADEFDSDARQLDTLLHLIANGVLLDKSRQHSGLWVWIIRRLSSAGGPQARSSYWGVTILRYPSHLVLHTAVLAAVLAGDEEVIVELLTGVTDYRPTVAENPLVDELARGRIVNDDTAREIRQTRGEPESPFPASAMIYDVLRPIFLPLVGTEDEYDSLFKRGEYRWAIAAVLPLAARRTARLDGGVYSAEYEWEDPYEGPHGTGDLRWAKDFLQRGNPLAWGISSSNADEFHTKLKSVTAALRARRRT